MPRRKIENNDVLFYVKTETKMTEENLSHQLLSDMNYKESSL